MSSPPPTSPPPMVWPPQGNVVPFPLPWGQTGCCPPGGMDALMKCYCDIQAATAFICKVMVDCVQNNPAVVQAIIAAIEASGSSVPLIGVTNGQPAQPGQVGEFVQFTINGTGTIPAGGALPITITAGILQPGDWSCEGYLLAGLVDAMGIELNPVPTGFSNNMYGTAGLSAGGSTGLGATGIPTPPAQALISVPTLVVFQGNLYNGGASPLPVSYTFIFTAFRMR